MQRFLPILLLGTGLWAQQAADVLKRVHDAYANLNTAHIVATRTDAVIMANGAGGQGEGDYELAEGPGGKYLARVKSGDNESLAVSDGSTTWKALPKQKRWMKLEAAGVSDDEEAGEESEQPHDLHTTVGNMLIHRYVAFARYAGAAELGKEENVKVGGVKIRCQIVRVQVGATFHELWVDEQRGFVLQHRQTSRQQFTNGTGQLQLTTKIKQLDINTQVDDHLFSFTPERSWSQAEMLALPGEEQTVLTGQKAADFALKSTDGEQVELASLRGKVVVLDFWATWCGPCRRELPIVDKLRAEFGSDVQFLGINDEDNGTVKGFLKKNGYGLTVLMDSKHTVNRTYGVRSIPTLLVIDRDGVIRQHFVGGREEKELHEAIAAVLGAS